MYFFKKRGFFLFFFFLRGGDSHGCGVDQHCSHAVSVGEYMVTRTVGFLEEPTYTETGGRGAENL